MFFFNIFQRFLQYLSFLIFQTEKLKMINIAKNVEKDIEKKTLETNNFFTESFHVADSC